MDQIREEKLDTKVQGDSLVLTLNTQLQQVCYDALGDNKGAIVVLEPSTGKVLAMVSKPDFDPNTIEQDWDALINDDSNSSLFNRALQGQYPPGSTFKILTTLEYIREHPDDYQNFNYTCNGSISKEDVRITCYEGEVHGYENLEQAFVHSCNGAFAQIGMEVNNDSYRKLCESFLFNKDLPIDLPSSQSLFRLSSNASYGEEMMTAIGQGETVVSPFEMALVAATVANGGTMMNHTTSITSKTYDGDIVKQYAPVKYKELMSEEEVDILSGFMKEVVTDGTARKISGEEYTAAGKTGSAEYGSEGGAEGTHSWFVGYLDAENPKLAISVIIETAVPEVLPQSRQPRWYLTNGGTNSSISSNAKENIFYSLRSAEKRGILKTVLDTTHTGGIAMIEATSCGGVVIFRGKILLLYKATKQV